jgi:hypothetical protein
MRELDNKMFLIEPGHHVPRREYVAYLHACADRWRHQPNSGTDASIAANEEQARRVEAKADRIARGEED